MKKAPAALTGGGLILQQGQQPDDAQQLGSLLHLFAAVLPCTGVSVFFGGILGGDASIISKRIEGLVF